MNILMVTMGLEIGGAETHIVELCRALADMGHTVTVASNGGVYEKELAECGVTHVNLPLNTKRPTAMIRSYFGLKKLISNGNFDVVHAHARIPAFICALVRKSVDFRFTTTAHLDFRVNGILRAVTKWGEKSLAVSEDIKKYLVDNYGLKPENISLTINGIDARKFSPDTDTSDVMKEFGLTHGARRIVYISRLDADRSLVAYHLIAVADKLCERFGDLEFVIVGSGGDYTELCSLADKANSKLGRRAIVMTGGRTDINKMVALADVFVAVSRSALEAMAAARPVIVAGNQGYMGIFDETKLDTGISTNFCCRGCPMPTEDALLADITALLSETPEQLAVRGEYNRSVVLEHYSVTRMANDYLGLYASLPPYTDFRYADIVMSGYYGFENMGDDSLLGTIAGNLRALRPNIKIAALTKRPREMTEMTGIRCISRTSYPAICRQLRHAGLLISGGGTLIQDGTSSKSLMYYLFIMRLAKKCGAKLYVYANGAGPLYRKSSKRSAAKIVDLADRITVREPDAKATLISLGIAAERITVTADPAFMIKRAGDPDEIAARLGLAPEKKYYAVSLRECTGKVAREIDTEELADKVAEACSAISRKYGSEPVFIPMQPKHDAAICANVRAKLGFGHQANGLTAGELCSLLEKMEFVIGMRLHMLVFASHMCVPMVGLSYDPKINGLMHYIGQDTLLRAQDFKVDELISAVDNTIMDSARIRASLAESSERLTGLAYSDITAALGMADR